MFLDVSSQHHTSFFQIMCMQVNKFKQVWTYWHFLVFSAEMLPVSHSVMHVVSPSVAMVAAPKATEFGERKAEVASLKRQPLALHVTGRHKSNSKSRSNRRTWSWSCSLSQSGVLYCGFLIKSVYGTYTGYISLHYTAISIKSTHGISSTHQEYRSSIWYKDPAKVL